MKSFVTVSRLCAVFAAALFVSFSAEAQNDPTATPEKMADILRSQIMEFRSIHVTALVVGSDNEGVALLSASDSKAPFLVRSGNVIARELGGINVRLVVKSVTSEGVEIEAPTLTERLLIPSAFKLKAPLSQTQLKPGDLHHIECNAVSMEDAVRLVADQTGLNIAVSAQAATTPVSIFLRNVPASVAVEELCRSCGLWFRADEKSGIVRVMTMKEYESNLSTFREEQTQSFTLLYPNVVEIAAVLYGLYPDRVYLSLGEKEILDDEKEDISRRFDRLEMFDNSSSSTLLSLNPGTSGRSGGSSGTSFDSSRNNNQLAERYTSKKEKIEGLSAEYAKSIEAARGNGTSSTNEIRRMLDVFSDKSPSIFVTVSRRNNMIIIRTSDPQIMKEISDLIRRLDVATPSVLLEMKILQVELENGYNSSFEFELNGKTSIDGKTYTGTAGFPGLSPLSADGRTDTATFRILSDHFSTRIQLLESTGKAKSLATPTMLVANNEVSRLFIGEQVPITIGVTMEPVNGTVDGVTTTVGYTVDPQIQMQAIGTMLLVTPNINADRSVTLRLMQEESSINPNGGTIPYGSAAALQSYKVDTVLSRRISGTFLAQDNLMTALGGLITEKETEEVSRVPYLGRIPLLGFFFRSKEKVNKRSELVILIRPHVISTPSDGEQISRKLMERITPSHAETLFSTNAVPTNLPPATIEGDIFDKAK